MDGSLWDGLAQYAIDPMTGAQLNPPAEAQRRASNVFEGLLQGAKDWLTLPKRAMDEGITTDQAVNWAAPTALGMVGMARLPGGVPEGAVGAGGAKLVQPEGIRAYHGSPHDFDRFDISKIGTGEGAQAYGHGLYFAENEGVARGYRDRLEDIKTFQALRDPQIPDFLRNTANMLVNERGPQGAAARLREMAAKYPDEPGLNRAADIIEQTSQAPGRMYEVNINAHPDQFLDWDKPLPQQAPAIRDAALEMFGHNKRLWDKLGDKEKVAYFEKHEGNPMPEMIAPYGGDQLQAYVNAGIPGIKYLDQGSRAAGEGSRNYVVFNDKIIDILRKYGILAPGGGAAADMYMRAGAEQQ